MLKTETISINMGPHHPSTHGVFRMILTLDGETVVDLKPMFGYLHRGLEKTSEERTYLQAMPFTDRLDYICSMTNNFAYAVAVETLADIEVPPRAEYIRVIMAELTRLVNHMLGIGFLFNELGAWYTPVVYAFRERERIMDLFEMASGSRMMCNYVRPGGVAADLPEEFLPLLRKLIPHLERFVAEIRFYLSENEIFRARSVGVGFLPADMAVANSITGPVLRASGVAYDVRKAEPYSVYDQLEFDVPTQVEGDVYARYVQRLDEMDESLRILRQAVERIPDGEFKSKVPSRLRPPKGESYARIEAPKGELGFYLVSDGSPNPYRWRNRPPSLINLSALREMCLGHKVADVVVIYGSIDVTLADIDR
jgi:NADH:ubiquinone oxidoreductase subunit D